MHAYIVRRRRRPRATLFARLFNERSLHAFGAHICIWVQSVQYVYVLCGHDYEDLTARAHMDVVLCFLNAVEVNVPCV